MALKKFERNTIILYSPINFLYNFGWENLHAVKNSSFLLSIVTVIIIIKLIIT